MKALAKDPQERPQTPMEFLRALRPAPPSESRTTPSRKRTWLAVAGLMAGLLAVPIAFWAGRSARVAGVAHSGSPIVALMDTPVPHGVYDQEILVQAGT